MSERKVLNKYIPPNFDPSRIPKRHGGKGKQHTVRLMAPFSMRCNTCGEYIYKGRKFNARKETVEGEEYLGIRVFRFYIRCPQCAAEITYKTDPKNADYSAEHGAKRNFEPWREERAEEERVRTRRLLEETHNPMKALENKTYDSKRELDIVEALDEIRTLNAKMERVDADIIFERIATEPIRTTSDTVERIRYEQEEDDKIIREAFARVQAKQDEPLLQMKVSTKDLLLGTSITSASSSTSTNTNTNTGTLVKKRLDPLALGIVPKGRSKLDSNTLGIIPRESSIPPIQNNNITDNKEFDDR